MECKEQEDALKWCMAFQHVHPTRCQPLVQELSRCYAKLLL